ncbi:hypothetical protein HTS88_15655 [Pseudarthrobacter oxydans]|uniref:hypothetical protein n=1 Tax=Pseudarthrobacter oxydans TaxID=1671 RepID=UPI001572D593|nr:hypothetical protein [Pseudarthrobacter oxydans]NSX37819.1 hypothetical protein [Pseudarthrobacter oxydans]
MTTDKDILAALHGRPTGQQKAAHEATIRALAGGTSDRDRAYSSAVIEALGGTPAATTRTDISPSQRRGDSLEPVAIWAAKEAAAAATTALAEAIMRADGTKGIYLAEAEAREIAAETYTEAAKGSPYEDARQKHVARALTKIAEAIVRTKESAAKPNPRPSTQPLPQTTAGTPRQKRESRSAMNPDTVIISYT